MSKERIQQLIFLAVVIGLLWITAKPGTFGPIGGGKAPFKADKLTVLVTHDAAAVGSLPSWVQGNAVATVEGWTKGHQGDFRLLANDAKPELLEAKWQAAFAVPRTQANWITAAGVSTGFSKPLPATAAETIKLLEGVK